MEVVNGKRSALRLVVDAQAYSPDTAKSIAAGGEVDEVAVGRPLRRCIPGGAIGERHPGILGRPRLAQIRRYQDPGMSRIHARYKRDRALVGRESGLHQVVFGML